MRNGPCLPWADEATLRARPAVARAVTKALEGTASTAALSEEQVTTAIVDSCIAASEVLYLRTARVFSGRCGPVTVRPVSRPTDGDQRMLAFPFGWAAAWGYATAFGGIGSTNVVPHYGPSMPRQVFLGAWPVTSEDIIAVLINGEQIPADEYEVRDGRWLVRLRPTASSVPTQMWGWPTSQIPDLPDDQPGTFSVTFMFGQAPPQSGIDAAAKLAESLVLPKLGDTDHMPTRVTSIARQGVTQMITDVLDLLNRGMVGIWEVDLFIKTVNPEGMQRQATVWSPDMGRARRVPSNTYRP
jgi:hypothetical protein